MAATAPRKKTVAPKSEVDVFEFTTEAGETVTVPAFKSIKPGVIRKTRKLDQADQFWTILESLADDDAIAIIDEMDADEFQEFQREWFGHSGVDLGESSAS
ncbi:hypothetical protein [Prescottella agglutinans]|uniref:Mg/Co/Ni transporter MgtE n=1 Tax=Prescottella agglutinans TaxID=1644129 RepID=A0ABT6M4X8_9NOCA|nr:hypothetical protein [Prescottella agglutinans]MDH6279340.1 Mg/Co/Ni transporter MgtE [Prescottella agglutinans]